MITYIKQLVDSKGVILLLRIGHFEIKLIQMRSYLLVSWNEGECGLHSGSRRYSPLRAC